MSVCPHVYRVNRFRHIWDNGKGNQELTQMISKPNNDAAMTICDGEKKLLNNKCVSSKEIEENDTVCSSLPFLFS